MLRNMCIFQLEHREPVDVSQDASRHLQSNARSVVAEQLPALAHF